MIISHSLEFIFIHIYRTGGTSIRTVLSKYDHQHNGTGSPFFKGEPTVAEPPLTFPRHITALKLKEEITPPIFDKYYKFAFVRNPWDWQVSLYAYMLQEKSHFQHDIVSKMSSFENYIEWRVHEDKHLQKEFVTDEEGKLVVDFLGRFESIEKEFEKIADKLGIQEKLPHNNKSDHKNYRQYYNNRTSELIYDHFQEDIQLFGYSF